MKTVRFSDVVKRCGPPETRLVLVKPAKDKALQAAIKVHRVMTIFQPSTGTRTDFGEVGFKEGTSRQYLVFPKSLRAFAGRKVVGVKYDLLSSTEVPKSQQARRPKASRKRVRKPAPLRPVSQAPLSSKVVRFPVPEDPDEDEQVREMKRLARQAMRALEAGKHVAAFHLLKLIAAS